MAESNNCGMLSFILPLPHLNKKYSLFHIYHLNSIVIVVIVFINSKYRCIESTGLPTQQTATNIYTQPPLYLLLLNMNYYYTNNAKWWECLREEVSIFYFHKTLFLMIILRFISHNCYWPFKWNLSRCSWSLIMVETKAISIQMLFGITHICFK